MSRNLSLITALGAKADLFLQLVDFFNGGERYPYNAESALVRRRFAGMVLTDLHLVCTREKAVEQALQDLHSILTEEYPGLRIHPVPLPFEDISCSAADEHMRGLVYDRVKELADDGLIIASGGRKTVTNRLIEAGLLHGCMGYFTLTAPQGCERRECSASFHAIWLPTRRFVEERRPALIKDKTGDNFRSLALLPLSVLNRLQREKVGADPARADYDLAWLSRLPKADLHCHLGGAFDPLLLKRLAAALLDDLAVQQQRRLLLREKMENIFGRPLAELTPADLLALAGDDAPHCLTGLKPLQRRFSEPAHLVTAVLVDGLTPEQIEALSHHRAPGAGNRLEWYMRCGDLGGSSLLQSRTTLRLALRWLMTEAARENVRFLEVRFSPENCTRAGLAIPEVIETLLDEAATFTAEHQGFHVNFLIMATRHKERAAMTAQVDAAVAFGRPGDGEGPRITGFDLAGQEEGNDPEKFQDIFLPLHRHFMNVTIHAGEMAEDDRIWQAIYLLHARRIGHGLKLVNNPRMMGYVRDHNIAIEMCPSSNRATNGFRRFDTGETDGDIYPLGRYLESGLTVTVNTDNRGISQTTLSREYLTAARLSQGGLCRWDILRLVRNGFRSAFLPKDEKDRLLRRIDGEIFNLILDDIFPEQHHAHE